MPRSFCIPGIIFLFCAFVLLFISSISLPYLTAMDITRTHFTGSSATTTGSDVNISQIRFGVWAFCYDWVSSSNIICDKTGHAYSVSVGDGNGQVITIGRSWTRGLAVHPVATIAAFVALLFSFSTHVTLTLIASLLSFLAASLTLIAFAIDIALYAYVKHQMNKLTGVGPTTKTGPGFWLTFASLILLLLAGCTVCFGRRRDRMSGATSYPMANRKPGFFGRFRRNRA
jgi:hypothetical protein